MTTAYPPALERHLAAQTPGFDFGHPRELDFPAFPRSFSSYSTLETDRDRFDQQEPSLTMSFDEKLSVLGGGQASGNGFSNGQKAIFVDKADFDAAVRADRDDHINDVLHHEDNGHSTMVYDVVARNELEGGFGVTNRPQEEQNTGEPFALFNSLTNDELREADAPSESSATPGPQIQTLQPQYSANDEPTATSRPLSTLHPSTPKHPSATLAGASSSSRPESLQNPIIPASASPSYRPQPSAPRTMPVQLPKAIGVSISSNSRAIVQQPMYITPPSSPTPIAVNPVYVYAAPSPYTADVATPATQGVSRQRASSGAFAAQQQQQLAGMGYAPTGLPYLAPEGREICVECAMRDQDMADVDVTSPGIWERESDVYYQELCAREAEEDEERTRTSSGSHSEGQSHVIRAPHRDPNRPRARGLRLTEQNIKLWLSMNPREPQARQQTLSLYVKTQTALLEAEALARARAIQESMVLENKLRNTYDNLRRSTYDLNGAAASGQAVDETGILSNGRKKGKNSSPRRSTSGPAPASSGVSALSLGAAIVDGPGTPAQSQHGRHQSKSQSRDVTLLENGMIVEHVDVRKEEKERRREEKRERERERQQERERSRARKGSRSSGADVLSMYSTNGGTVSPLPQTNATDSGFYSDSRDRGDRPISRYSVSQSSTRAMSVLTTPPVPLTPPASQGQGQNRPPNARMHSQISLADTRSVSSASMNRRSRFFAFKNWSEAWKSRESFAPTAVSMNGSMMDMHLALDREKQQMAQALTANVPPTQRLSDQWPRRSQSTGPEGTGTLNGDRPKKKKGFAKIWNIVTGSSKASKANSVQRELQPTDRSEDDYPLAPPPSLSYLVNRTSTRERSMSTSASSARRVSTNTVPNIVAQPPLPTPTSIKSYWQEGGSGLAAHSEEPIGSNGSGVHGDGVNGYFVNVDEQGRNVHPALSEPDMRQRVQDQPSLPIQNTVSGFSGRVPSSPRPISVYSLHKQLPPLPHEVSNGPSSHMPSEFTRPQTMFNLDSPTVREGDEDLLSPDPAFRREGRRQSFGGTSSRPDHSNAQTFPLNGRHADRTATYAGSPSGYGNENGYAPYNEMGASRSLGRLGEGQGTGSSATLGIRKRRSKFGLANLLGKLSRPSTSTSEARVTAPTPENNLPSSRPSESDVNLDAGSVTEYGASSSRSKHTNNGGGLPSRMSVASRKAIEELVDQDPEFVAYRYPSVDQNIIQLR